MSIFKYLLLQIFLSHGVSCSRAVCISESVLLQHTKLHQLKAMYVNEINPLYLITSEVCGEALCWQVCVERIKFCFLLFWHHERVTEVFKMYAWSIK